MGDNRHNAMDSRYLGLIPEYQIVGKAIFIYYSNTEGRTGKNLETKSLY
jgi:type IV secretory pathway protease TraF